jgi:hypothetical protein
VKRLLRHLLVIVLVVVWIGAVVYPDPRPFITSVGRLIHPPVDAQAVSDIAADLPNDYKAIEQYSNTYVTWKPAWTVYGLPWYFPTVKELLVDHAGDCQAQALLMASILEAKGMPYTLMYSFDHVWVDYPGRTVTQLEDPATAFVSNAGKGWLAWLPHKLPIWSILKVRVAYHWTPMPLLCKILILLGAAVIVGWGERRFFRRLWRFVRRPLPRIETTFPGSPLYGRPRSH